MWTKFGIAMHLHASCAAQGGSGVLLLGEPGSGKSDLLLRLIDRGFDLVADDRVVLEDGIVSAPAALAGLIEVRGIGIIRHAYIPEARLVLVVRLGRGERLPEAAVLHGVPVVGIDPQQASAPVRVATALHCATGSLRVLAGAFV